MSTDDTTCETCSSGYGKESNGICTKCVNNCTKCSEGGKKCTEC